MIELTRKAPTDQPRQAAPGHTGLRTAGQAVFRPRSSAKSHAKPGPPLFSGIDLYGRNKHGPALRVLWQLVMPFAFPRSAFMAATPVRSVTLLRFSHRPPSRCLLCARLRAPVRPRSRCTCRSLPAASYGRSFLAGCPGHSQAAREKGVTALLTCFTPRRTKMHRLVLRQAHRTWRPVFDWGLFPPPKPPRRLAVEHEKLASTVPGAPEHKPLFITSASDTPDLLQGVVQTNYFL